MIRSKIEAVKGAQMKENKHRKGRKKLCVLCVVYRQSFLYKITPWVFVILPPKEVRVHWFFKKQTDLTGSLKVQIPGCHP